MSDFTSLVTALDVFLGVTAPGERMSFWHLTLNCSDSAYTTGASCSKLTTSLVYVSLKFQR